MNLTLHTGDFQPWLEEECVRNLRRDLEDRPDPLREQALIVVPTRLLRTRLYHLLARANTGAMFGFRVVTLNHLCMEVALNFLDTPHSSFSGSLYFPFALYRIAQKTGNKRFTNFRICAALHQTMKDLTDGGISSELLNDVLDFAHQDPELSRSIDLVGLQAVAEMHRQMEDFVRENRVLPLQAAAFHAAVRAGEWIARRNIRTLHLYGFYDSTQSQYDVLESAIRSVTATDGTARIYFPLPVSDAAIVSHPAVFAQQFYDKLHSLCAALGGEVLREPQAGLRASAGVERFLFLESPPAELLENARNTHRIEFFSAAGRYDAAWAVAKRILDLVIHQGARFDQILVVSRSAGEDLAVLTRVFADNRIPCSWSVRDRVAHLPAARFALTLLKAREARMNAASLFEFLSSPFLPGLAFRDFRNIRKLMDECAIHNWDDWDRLRAVLRDPETAPVFEREDESGIRSLRATTDSLYRLKRLMQYIPEKGSLPEFARSLTRAMDAVCGTLQSSDLAPVFQALAKLRGLDAFVDFEITLPEFADLLKQHMESEEFPAPPDDAESRVTVGDIMQLRGCCADYVFLIGLNQDVFPRRTQEDPFLPDNARRMLRALTGAGPALRRSESTGTPSLLPLKEGTGEELLLYYLALRAASRRLYVSFQRADEKGQKLACSTYLDETLRLLTSRTAEANPAVRIIPKHQVAKFDSGALPTPAECSLLSTLFSADEVVLSRHNIPGSYVDHLRGASARLNSRDLQPAEIVDGCITDAAGLWPAVMTHRKKGDGEQHLQLSYSRFKDYLQCPFRFFSREILQLQESPRDAAEAEHDLNALLKGRMAEDVVKGALRRIREEVIALAPAVDAAVAKTAERYSQILPPLLLDVYMPQFQEAALKLLTYLQRQGFRLQSSTTPDRVDMIEAPFVPGDSGAPAITIRGIPDVLLSRDVEPDCIGELKWGTRAVGSTPSYMFSQGEAQFCIYPELLEHSTGKRLPFRYFRLDAFQRYDAPDTLEREMALLKPPHSRIQIGKASRILGGEAFPRAMAKGDDSQERFFEQCRNGGKSIQGGQFRIIKDPGIAFSACRTCSFTQICRKSHTGTLLRARRAHR